MTRPGIVHRLDRDTSGVIVIAKDDSAHLHLSRQFEQRTVHKEYFAICRGQLDRDRDWIDQPLAPHPYQREKMAIRPDHPAARPGANVFRGAATCPRHPGNECPAEDGSHSPDSCPSGPRGCCPILCDPLYSGARSISRGELTGGVPDGDIVLDRLALHARSITLAHPNDERPLSFEAPLPAEFELVQQIIAS